MCFKCFSTEYAPSLIALTNLWKTKMVCLYFQTSKGNRFEFFSCDKVDFKIWNIHIKLWVFKESGIGLQLYWFQFVLWTSVIPSKPTVFLVLCCQGGLCVLEVVKINTLGVFCQRECFSWRVQGHYFDGLCVVIWFGCLVYYLVVFWGLDVALVLRVNQYKLLVYLSLSLWTHLISVFSFTGINNRLFQRNNRLFFCCFAVLLLIFLANLILVLDSYKEFC